MACGLSRPALVAAAGLTRVAERTWDQPYLETCCRSALHRLFLAGRDGRPDDLADAPCLRRLGAMALVEHGGTRFRLTEAGRVRHRREVLRTE